MEKGFAVIGSRQSHLVKYFNLALRFLLTASSKEDFIKGFSSFTHAEQESLHGVFIQVITSMHKVIEDEFESLCLEMQVGNTLDAVEQLVEEQNLDPLFLKKTNVMDVAHDLSMAKKNEISHLRSMLEKAEEQNLLIRSRVEALKSRCQNVSGSADAIDKLKSGISSAETLSSGHLGME